MLWWPLLWTLVLCETPKWREVSISQGPVRGQEDPEGGLFAFYGIPYASTPKGKDRFKAPLPPPTWVEPLEAVSKNIICMQPSAIFVDPTYTTMEEDCLIANVYVPDTETKNLPVLVYIHGGAFEVGFGDSFTPKHLVRSKEIIVVTFNYRLSAHGFLCLGTEDVPGNAGMKDQVALLKWVRKNIASFGGNPDDVTIAGYSAGSISAELLMLSKTTDGLFSKVILESGTGTGFIAVQRDPIANAKEFAKEIGYLGNDDVHSLEEFYKSKPLESIVEFSSFFKTGLPLLPPCIERPNGDAFLEDDPINIIKQGKYKKLPILIGFSNMEGLLQLSHFKNWKNAMNDNFMDFLPLDLKFDDDKEEYAMKIKQFYFKDKAITEENILSFVDYYSDIFFIYSTLRVVKLHVEAGHTKVYLYEYDFVDEDTPLVPHTEVRGATHCAQTMAVLDGGGFSKPNENDLSEEFREMKEMIRELWSNFVKYGKPVPEESSLPPWPPANAIRAPYMALNIPLQLRGALYPDRARFWDNIYEIYYDAPKPPVPSVSTHTEL